MTGERSVGSILASAVFAAGLTGASCKNDHDQSMAVDQSDCVVCHYDTYEATTMPPHLDLFDSTCADCHMTTAWIPAVPINHEWFPIRGRHLDNTCTDCHTVGFRSGDTPNTCVGCHQMDYDGATMPPHEGYPTDCASCHDESGWSPSTFAHSWTLDGAHAVTPCQRCHVGSPPVYMGTPRECVGCHRADYDMSPVEGHQTFPTTCADCHTTTAWSPALEGAVAHPTSRFPINGKHDFACLDCHDPALGPSTGGMNTNCVGCHTGEHTRARMDRKHNEVRDYPSGDAAPNFCLMCHPDGRN